MKVAKQLDDVNFCVSDKSEFSRELNDLGLADSKAAVVVGLYDNKGKYAMETDFR